MFYDDCVRKKQFIRILPEVTEAFLGHLRLKPKRNFYYGDRDPIGAIRI